MGQHDLRDHPLYATRQLPRIDRRPAQRGRDRYRVRHAVRRRDYFPRSARNGRTHGPLPRSHVLRLRRDKEAALARALGSDRVEDD